MKHRKLLIVIILAFSTGVISERFSSYIFTNPDRIIFLSVGQGDCTLFQCGPYNVLVDTGPAGENNSIANRLLIPSLREYGVHSIDLLFITHPDYDHMGGLKMLNKRYSIQNIVLGDAFKNSSKMHNFLKEANIDSSKIIWLNSRSKFHLRDVLVDVVQPKEMIPFQMNSTNDNSLCINILDGRSSAILTGDASCVVELYMLNNLPGWSADVLKAGHHGSRYSTSSKFLDAYHPKYVVFSCGVNNSYNHPHPRVQDIVKKRGISIQRTDSKKNIEFRASDTGFVLD